MALASGHVQTCQSTSNIVWTTITNTLRGGYWQVMTHETSCYSYMDGVKACWQEWQHAASAAVGCCDLNTRACFVGPVDAQVPAYDTRFGLIKMLAT